MKKNMRKYVFTSLCFALCGILYVASGFATKENVEVKAAKKAIDASEIKTGYRFYPGENPGHNNNACIKTKEEFVSWYQDVNNAVTDEQKRKATPPYVTYVYNGEQLLVLDGENAGKGLVCNDGSLEDRCIYGAEGYYYDAGFTDLATRSSSARVGDVVKQITLSEVDTNGCAHYVEYLTILYINCDKCRENNTYEINYHMPDGTTVTETQMMGVTVNLKTLTQTGKKFEGWYYTNPGTNEEVMVTSTTVYNGKHSVNDYVSQQDGVTVCDKDVVDLYPKFTEEESCSDDYNKTYKTYFYDEDKTTILKEVTKDYGTYPDLFVPTKEGYTFEGWYTEDDTRITDSTKLAIKATYGDDDCPNGYANVKLYAKYKADEVNIKCKVLNGKIYYLDDEGSILKTAELRIKGDLDKNKMEYYVDGELVETTDISETLKVNDKVTFEEIKKDGYNFIGWYADAKYTKKITTFEELDAASEQTLGTYIDEDNCLTSRFNYNVYAKYEKIPSNPDTGDMIFIYIALGLVLVAGSGIAIKKLISNK